MAQPAKSAAPLVAGAGLEAQLSVPAPVPGVIERAMEAVSVLIWLPPASSMATIGWVAQAVPPVPPPGAVVKASWAGGPSVTEKAVLVPLAGPDVAVRV